MGVSTLKGITFEIATDVKITNFNITLANTEYSHVLQDKVKQIILFNRDYKKTQISFTVGQSGTNYLTVVRGCERSIDGISLTGKTLYFRSEGASTLEILELF